MPRTDLRAQRLRTTSVLGALAGILALLALSAPLHATCTGGQIACCLSEETVTVVCPTGACQFQVCQSGYDSMLPEYESQCVSCSCGTFTDWFSDGGSCANVSPEKQASPGDAVYGAPDPPVYAYIRSCDGSYALVRIGRSG